VAVLGGHDRAFREGDEESVSCEEDETSSYQEGDDESVD